MEWDACIPEQMVAVLTATSVPGAQCELGHKAGAYDELRLTKGAVAVSKGHVEADVAQLGRVRCEPTAPDRRCVSRVKCVRSSVGWGRRASLAIAHRKGICERILNAMM